MLGRSAGYEDQPFTGLSFICISLAQSCLPLSSLISVTVTVSLALSLTLSLSPCLSLRLCPSLSLYLSLFLGVSLSFSFFLSLSLFQVGSNGGVEEDTVEALEAVRFLPGSAIWI